MHFSFSVSCGTKPLLSREGLNPEAVPSSGYVYDHVYSLNWGVFCVNVCACIDGTVYWCISCNVDGNVGEEALPVFRGL